MPNVLLEEVQGEDDREEIRYFFLEDDPEVMLDSCNYCQFLL